MTCRIFEQIIREHGLIALNSWATTQASFRHEDHTSRIDYIFTRVSGADAIAKRSDTDWDFPQIHDTLHTYAPILTTIPSDHRRRPPHSTAITLSGAIWPGNIIPQHGAPFRR